MKKYFQSAAYITFIGFTLFALMTAIKSYENPFSLYENPLVWIAIVALILVILMKELVNIVAQQKAEQLQMEKDGVNPEEVDHWAWAKKLINKWTEAKAVEEEEEIILDHNYDGIKELDNNLPPWWLYMFYATIIFGCVYLVRYHMLGADNQEMEYVQSVEQAKRELAAFRSTSKEAVIDAETVTVLTSESDLNRGKAVYNLNCAACHIADGGGGIGPNLTDEYWILGGGIKNVFNTITNGGRDGKGMVAWGKTLKPKDIQKVASYILKFQGTTPAKPKAPQGEKYVEEGTTAEVKVEEQAKDSIQ
ncbi:MULTISPECIES: cbb3-type cytochrome c oxidase N-terminal domain-containing protein [unclassified Tenacibaculum]|uniref:cbb3-type cytochrome c oxidase N-terminal domain-containing protein n=1 Tax=unclassified Tenacibaculum TaxID=2635139 RepID=UPI001F3A1239|nr:MULTISPECIES: cbb3-type cytochrome c oxidase N-terminal domain-containing protein [unclassified Tenacibaculum]MCF2876299.1 c-type cytochrome [Tenacibaculum sp. Cn5-1]MCF2936374.1 c-type cytochrome [Tenacibaculum sp. Cn5-34]MCG7511717.1 c-type cytochrome [Tenacibaculum sp. Cn5-46]